MLNSTSTWLVIVLLIALSFILFSLRKRNKNFGLRFIQSPGETRIYSDIAGLALIIIATVLLYALIIFALDRKYLKNFSQINDSIIAINLKLDSLLLDQDSRISVATGGITSEQLRKIESILEQNRVRLDSSISKISKIVYIPETNEMDWKKLLFSSILIIGFALLVWGELFAKTPTQKLTRIVGFSILTGAELLKVGFDTKFSLRPTINIGCPCDSASETNVHPLIDLGKVGPFIEGFDSISQKFKYQFDSIEAKIADHRTFSEIFIYAGVDNRPLIRNSAKKFRDNFSLAQARANVINDSLLIYVSLNKNYKYAPIIHSILKGASYFGKKDSGLYSKDRYVQVYGKE